MAVSTISLRVSCDYRTRRPALTLLGDTYLHSWEMLVRILTHEDCQDILLDIGMYGLRSPV